MKVKFYGTRGSLPVCEPGFQEFGGNTTCIQMKFEDTGRIGIIDAGTGIRKLGRDLKAAGHFQDEIVIGFSHFHWDHIQGFPFFGPAFDGDQRLRLIALGKGREITNLQEIFTFQMQGAFFPVQLDNMGAEMIFFQPNLNTYELRGTKSSAIRHNHPGGAFTYRIERYGKTFAFCTDIEHGEEIDQNVVDFCKGVDLLIHDAQFTKEELKTKRGWGHSSYDQAIQVAEMTGAKQLIMTHHDPDHDDEFLKKREKECQDRFKDCVLAREGMEVQV